MEKIELVRQCVDQLCALVDKFKMIIGAAFDFEELFKECYLFAAGKFYDEYGLELDDYAIELISEMLGEVRGIPIDRDKIEEICKYRSVDDYFHDYFFVWVVNQLVKMDKIAVNKNGISFEDGVTIVHYGTMEDFLKVLCERNNISFDDSDFCSECMKILRDVIEDKWGSTNMMIF